MKKIKVALVGTGNWCLQHCRVLKEHPKVEFFVVFLVAIKKEQKKGQNYLMCLTIWICKN